MDSKNNQLHEIIDSSHYLYRLVLKLNRLNADDGLVLSGMVLTYAKSQRHRKRESYCIKDCLELAITDAIAAGRLMEDWIAERIAIGHRDTKIMREAWVRTAAVIASYIVKAGYIDIDPGREEEPNPQNDIPKQDERVRLEF